MQAFPNRIHLPHSAKTNFNGEHVFSSHVQPQKQIASSQIIARICPNTIKRTTTNGICIVCHVLWPFVWDIQHRPSSIHSIYLIEVFDRHFCHINVSIVDIFIIVAYAVPFCYFLHSFFSFPSRCYQQKGQLLVHMLPFNTSFGCHCFWFLFGSHFIGYPCQYHCVSDSFHFFFVWIQWNFYVSENSLQKMYRFFLCWQKFNINHKYEMTFFWDRTSIDFIPFWKKYISASDQSFFPWNFIRKIIFLKSFGGKNIKFKNNTPTKISGTNNSLTSFAMLNGNLPRLSFDETHPKIVI